MRHALSRLAELVCALPRGRESRDAGSAAILDLVAAAAAAPARPLLAGLEASFGAGASRVWFGGRSAAPAAAAFANSFAASALDLDDGHRRSRGHPGAAVIPAVFAEADRLESAGEGRDDDDIVHAIVAGYEACIRVASSKGFYARTGYWGGHGAAAGVAALRGLPADVMAQALAIAGETSPQMLTTTAGPPWPQPIGSDVKEGVPWSVANGVVAVGLAQAGFEGPLDMLDHEPFFDAEAILAPRNTLAIRETYTKFYSCCRHLHAPVDALLAVMAAHRLSAAEITAIEVGAYSGALRISNRIDPANLVDVQYSIPYCLGLAAVRGAGALLPLEEGCLRDRDAAAIAARVRLSIDEHCESRFPAETPARVAVVARGRRFESAVTTPRGEAGQTVSWADRIEKFRRATRLSLDDEERGAFLAAFEALSAGRLGPLRQRLALATRQASQGVSSRHRAS
ncbi:MAG: MmgE/PrpD family protein [Burkholderiales bacterium]|nr:MmgE/PrpD family protein [Burkholderiales bacterium]